MEVGFDVLALRFKDICRGPLSEGEELRVEGDDADRYVESVKECSSEAVANLDCSSSPLSESRNSCTPTVQPVR